MSSDRVNSVNGSSAATRTGAGALLEGNQANRVSQRALERKQIEAQAGVARLEKGAKVTGFSTTSTGGDDFIPRPGATPPPASSTVVPPPAALPPAVTTTPPAVTAPPTAATPPATTTPPPAGLQVGGLPGFPEGAVRTPGGYTVVATGDDARWNIYGPGQKPPEKPVSEVWGDPHVMEKDGTRWDFTKDSNFLLPDGTLIRADTTSEVGHSITQGLSIVSGNDRVEVTGVNGHNPKVSKSNDGEAWLTQNAPTLEKGATFALRTDGNNVDWFRATNGKLEGVITGSRENFDGQKSYDQIIGGAVVPTADERAARANGGTNFLGVDVEAFMASVGTALGSLAEADGLKEALSQAQSANRQPVRRAPAR